MRLSVSDLIAREREQGPEAAWPPSSVTAARGRDHALRARAPRPRAAGGAPGQRRAALGLVPQRLLAEFLRSGGGARAVRRLRDGRLESKAGSSRASAHDNELLLAET